MFNPHLSNLGYLHLQEDEGVFLLFPIATREILAQQICQCFVSGIVNPSILTTCVHVRIMMECIGQSFSLPLNSYKIIEAGIELYRRWLLDEKQRPQPIKDDEQFFYKELFKQLSVVFTKRQHQEESIEGVGAKESKSHKVAELRLDYNAIHVNLCNQVLDIYRSCGRQLKLSMLNDTWEALLKIVLGVADSLLVDPCGLSPVTEALTPNILNLLFELWIHSGPRSEEMWEKLRDLTRRWRHRLYTFTQWSNTCYAVNNRLLRLLFGPQQGTDTILFKQVNGETISIDIEQKEISNTWYRMLHLLGSFEGTISKAENYYEAISGIGRIARSFIDLQRDTLSTKTLPDGNSIFNICGGWLLDAVNHYQSGFDSGKEVALDVLCSLIHSRPQCRFHPNYLAFLFKGIEKALNTRHTSFLSVILTKTSHFFQSDVEGSHILIPAFVSSIERIIFLDKSEKAYELKSSSKLHELQKAALKILCALFCLPNHYRDAPFTSVSSKSGFLISNLPTLTSYFELHQHLTEILYEAVNTITNVDNLQLALSISSCYCYELIDIPNHKGYIMRYITLLLEKLLQGKWDQRNVLNAITILTNFSSIYHQLGASKEALAQSVVMSICKLIELKYFSMSGVSGDEVIICGYACILQWIVADQWIVNARECMKVFLEVIDLALNSKVPTEAPTERGSYQMERENRHSISSVFDRRRDEYEASDMVRLAAEYIFQLFFNYLGNFPLQTGPSSLSSLYSEQDILDQLSLDKKALTSYLANNVILNLIRFPRSNSTEVMSLVRDGIGKYIWRSKINYFIEPVAAPPPVKSFDPKKKSSSQPMNSLDKLLTQISGRMSDQEKEMQEFLDHSVKSLTSFESSLLSTSSDKKDEEEGMTAPVAAQLDYQEDLTVPRIFLTTFGFNSIDNPSEFSQININCSKNKDDIINFKALDQSRTRECFSATVMYFKGSTMVIGNHAKLPKDYQEFISKIGWEVSLKDHAGYRADLIESLFPTAPYFSDCLFELIFRVSTLACDEKAYKSRITDKSVYVSWVEDIHSYNPNDLKLEYVANIVINPLPTHLYRIRIFRSGDEGLMGPLQDDMIISKHILASTVRLTILNLCKSLHPSTGKPLYVRKAMIDLQLQSNRDTQNSFHKTHIPQFI